MNQSPARSVEQVPLGWRAVRWALHCHFFLSFPVYDVKELWFFPSPLPFIFM